MPNRLASAYQPRIYKFHHATVDNYGGELNGVYGQFYDVDGGNTLLFFPAAGYQDVSGRIVDWVLTYEGILYQTGKEGHYWTSTSLPHCGDIRFCGGYQAFREMFRDGVSYIGNNAVYSAHSVRCVKDINSTNSTDISNKEIKIYTQYHNIIIENTTATVQVYNIGGQVVAQGAGAGSYAVPTAGVYIVRIGSEVRKVIVP
jgi:hypothetical protein